MPKTALDLVNEQALQTTALRTKYEAEAEAWVAARMIGEDSKLEARVMDALDGGSSVTDVARAYTLSGRTPNRGAIYEIKAKYDTPGNQRVGLLPFGWVSRVIETSAGYKTLYDLQLNAEGIGPLDIRGTFLWKYESQSNTLTPVLDTEQDPYPTGEQYYDVIVASWVKENPYPKGG